MEQGFKVACLYTAPRYENVFCRNMIEKALADFGLRLTVSQGVFYGQCMQQMMEEMCDKADVILTIDGDSLFTSKHINRMFSTLQLHPEIDALAPLQIRRGMEAALFTTSDNLGNQVNLDEPVKVRTAHFGMTLLKTKALVDVPKPWFWSRPSPDGSWKRGTDKLDDDIYFWRNWEAAGKTLYVDMGCAIGHLEEMVADVDIQDNSLVVVHKYPADWRQENGC